MSASVPEVLLADVSLAPPPDDREVRAWAAGQSVFVSSVMKAMQAERDAVVAAIRAVGARPIVFEDFGGMDDDPESAYLGNVAGSDVYIGILGLRYGTPLKTGYSATHAEYNEAIRQGLRISVWTASGGLDGPQQDFLNAIRVFHTTGTYLSPDDLQSRVAARLQVMAGEALASWVKVGSLLFRATHIDDNGTDVVISARLRNNRVATALEAMRPTSGFGRNSDTRITWPDHTEQVTIREVTTMTETSQARTVTVTARRAPDGNRAAPMRMAVNDRSADDLTEIALRAALFDEPNSLGAMSFMATSTNPLPAIAELGLSEDAFEEVARLLVTEELVGRLHGGHITQFRLGPPHMGMRRLRLGWMPPKPYVNVDAQERAIEGEVRTQV